MTDRPPAPSQAPPAADPRAYAIVTASYWAFTLTDGALRMLVLFHLHAVGYTPLEVVSLFVFYELFGIVTTAVGGWLGARTGLRTTLCAGLALQILACSLLAARATELTVALVLVVQALSGIAKDLTKTSAKSYVKLLVPAGDRRGLMRWVALLTGSKNALKGAGFFVGGGLLAWLGFGPANLVLAGTLAVALVAAFVSLPAAMGKAPGRARLRDVVSRDRRVRWLAAARMFLFGARDVWFVFALPIFLVDSLAWSTAGSGAFLALWVIGYGAVQALAPKFVTRGAAHAPDGRHVLGWTAALLIPVIGLTVSIAQQQGASALELGIGLGIYGALFAANSAIHSFLIVDYAAGPRVSLEVGFYYMANATGRLLGTVLSGALFGWAGMGVDGLVACLVAAAVLVLASTACAVPLRAAEQG